MRKRYFLLIQLIIISLNLFAQTRPNILFIMTDDHGTGALSCYGSKINTTPNLDRLANEGMLLKNCYVTTSLCAPSRATILTGKYPHMNGQVDIGGNFFDGHQITFINLLHNNGYQTAVVGKWHLHSIPVGFDHYSVLPEQGSYFDPDFFHKTEIGPVRIKEKGYSTDIIANKAIDWMQECDKKKPFVLLCHFKSPHYNWEPDEKHQKMFADKNIPQPETFDHSYKGPATVRMTNKIAEVHDFFKIKHWTDMPKNLDYDEQKEWNYQRFIKDYLRCIASVDDNVGRILRFLDERGLSENTIVVYTTDNGMMQGDHGLVDKQLMQEESIRVPFLIRYPKEIEPGSESDKIVVNCDYAPTFLDYCNVKIPKEMQGASMRDILTGGSPRNWRKSFYYQYYAHYRYEFAIWGIRTEDMKLINYPRKEGPSVQQLFDLRKDPNELVDRINRPEYQTIRKKLEKLIAKHRKKLGMTEELEEKIYSKQGANNAIPINPAHKNLLKQIEQNTIDWEKTSSDE